jgi:hypothetical protein
MLQTLSCTLAFVGAALLSWPLSRRGWSIGQILLLILGVNAIALAMVLTWR